MKLRYSLLTLLLLCAACKSSQAQRTPASSSYIAVDSLTQTFTQKQQVAMDAAGSAVNLEQIPCRYLGKVTAKTQRFNSRITSRTEKALLRLQKQEEKIYKKLAKTDSAAAHNLLSHSMDSLSRLREIVKGKANNITAKVPGTKYIPYLDTLKNSLGFLSRHESRLDGLKEAGQGFDRLNLTAQGSLQQAQSNVQELEGRLNQLQNIQQYIASQQQALKESLSAYGDMFNKYLDKFGREAYYYKAQVENYQELWQHPDRVEAKAMDILNKVPAFSSFMKEHSMLAGLFRLPENYGDADASSLNGLQTRAMVERELQQRLQEAGAGGRQQIQQQMQQAQQQLQQLQNKLSGGGSVSDMPNFKLNDLRSKSIFQKLEYGANIQFEKAAGWYPATSDIAAQAGYKFLKNGEAGIGVSFKLGWGSFGSAQEPSNGSAQEPSNGSAQEPSNGSAQEPSNGSAQEPSNSSQGNFIRKIHFTAQGLGLRSFLDYKLKGSIYANAGFEFNYNKTIPNVAALKGWNGWNRSALLGIERKYKISSKVNGNVMLLYDFLYKHHQPITQPIVFRAGYNF